MADASYGPSSSLALAPHPFAGSAIGACRAERPRGVLASGRGGVGVALAGERQRHGRVGVPRASGQGGLGAARVSERPRRRGCNAGEKV